MPTESPRRLSRPLIAIVLLAIAVLAAWGVWTWLGASRAQPSFRLAKVERGNILAAVSASGTLSAVTTVQVGSTISGQIKEILVDFNTPVKLGQLLARIDPEAFELKVRQAEADLEASRTALLQRESDAAAQRSQLIRAKITHDDAQRDLERKDSLVQKGFISPADRDKAHFVERGAAESIKTVEAQVASAVAQVANGRALVKQRDAALASAKNDLSKTSITAPVDGVVISRQVEPGQTVAASLNTPTLFTIAQDLAAMQVDVSIDESDIGRIRSDQRVSFTVDAFPGRNFEGTVRQIRKAAQTVQNVVTYVVVVGTSNPGHALLPGMTANVRIVTDQRSNVLKVPNAALRWRPAGSPSAKDDPPAPGAGGGGGPGGGVGNAQAMRQRLINELKLDAAQTARLEEIFSEVRSRMLELGEVRESDRRQRSERIRAESRQKINAMLNPDQQQRYAEIIATELGRGGGASGAGRVYLPSEAGPQEVVLRTGLSDGNATEVVTNDLKEGDAVIVATAQPAAASAPRVGGAAPRLPF